MSEQTSRYAHIDIAKGMGMLLIVFGHNVILTRGLDHLQEIIFSFHVPLFFLLSGLFFRPDRDFKNILISKSDSLLKPYFFVLSGWALAMIIFAGASPAEYFFRIFYGTGPFLEMWGPLWFIPLLWAIFIFSWVFMKATGFQSRRPGVKSLLLAALLTGGYFAVHISHSYWGRDIYTGRMPLVIDGSTVAFFGLPFSMDLLLISSFYFLLGFTTKRFFLEFKFSAVLFISTLILFLSLHFYFRYSIDFNEREYAHLVVSSVQAVLGIYLAVCVSFLLGKSGLFPARILSYIGTGSLFILLFNNYLMYLSYELLKYVNSGHIYFNAWAAFAAAIAGPLLIRKTVMGTGLLSIFFLPLKGSGVTGRRREAAAAGK